MAFYPDILVTGSSGHLGHALMLSLAKYGYTALGIDILASSTPNTLVGSITDETFVNGVFTTYPSIRHIIHTATLHKPHVTTHTKATFIQTNITGTLTLLEAAVAARDRNHDQDGNSSSGHTMTFIFLSTTSAFGTALSPKPGQPAAWIDEDVVPQPKNIYGVTKVAAEDVCRLVHLQTGLPVVVLRTSRFFPEEDDDAERSSAMGADNLKVCELAYRRVDIADVVGACVAAVRKAAAGEVGWGKYIISAPTPLTREAETLALLNAGDGPDSVGEVLERAVPGCKNVFQTQNWTFLGRVDRVYDSSKAVRELGWVPTYTFQRAVEVLARGDEWKSELMSRVGRRGYHDRPTGVYTA
ncbi:NAD(P)-binding protein [Cryphonectria parasitica EP155]|uniref:NAD(P)-binding protein n=1 Tax=Cryphonectria parasitica (strain ATCC 38755 / EP155) TaxID=660469 RepID=A0A9P4XV68_CRYP1|nr:NAD(P)-binding protein [Cryphonectria parasitica EP155]KAF3761874.1 NAD(P)-binding protein [Cryphonectria parasitica EP155]